MLALELDKSIEQKLNRLATQQGKAINQLINEAIENLLEDAEDAALADAAIDDLISGKSFRVSFAELKRQSNDLDD